MDKINSIIDGVIAREFLSPLQANRSTNVIEVPGLTSDAYIHLENDDLEKIHLGLLLFLPQLFALHGRLSPDSRSRADTLTNEIPNA